MAHYHRTYLVDLVAREVVQVGKVSHLVVVVMVANCYLHHLVHRANREDQVQEDHPCDEMTFH